MVGERLSESRRLVRLSHLNIEGLLIESGKTKDARAQNVTQLVMQSVYTLLRFIILVALILFLPNFFNCKMFQGYSRNSKLTQRELYSDSDLNGSKKIFFQLES